MTERKPPCAMEDAGHEPCTPLTSHPDEVCSECLGACLTAALDNLRAIDIIVRKFLSGLPIGRSLLDHTRPFLSTDNQAH